jgi:hypothetical protein
MNLGAYIPLHQFDAKPLCNLFRKKFQRSRQQNNPIAIRRVPRYTLNSCGEERRIFSHAIRLETGRTNRSQIRLIPL